MVTVNDSNTLENVSGLDITCVTTGVTQTSTCSPLQFANKNRTQQSYSQAGGNGTGCDSQATNAYSNTPAANYPAGRVQIQATGAGSRPDP